MGWIQSRIFANLVDIGQFPSVILHFQIESGNNRVNTRMVSASTYTKRQGRIEPLRMGYTFLCLRRIEMACFKIPIHGCEIQISKQQVKRIASPLHDRHSVAAFSFVPTHIAGFSASRSETG